MLDLNLSALKQRLKFAAFAFGSLVTKDSFYFSESEEKDSRCSGMFQRCIRMHEVASELVREIFEFFDLFFQKKEIIMRKYYF